MRQRLLFVVVVAALAVIAGFALTDRSATTLVSLSPNEKLRVRLVELAWRLDRNFELELEDVASGRTMVIFRSPDEGLPIGSERVFWSRDSSRLLLVGRHFFVAGDVRTSTGEALYFLYDVRTGRAWCNAEPATRAVELRRSRRCRHRLAERRTLALAQAQPDCSDRP